MNETERYQITCRYVWSAQIVELNDHINLLYCARLSGFREVNTAGDYLTIYLIVLTFYIKRCL